MLPWHDAPRADEVNVVFTLENNLLYLTSARINGRTGRYFFASAAQRSALDPKFITALGGPQTSFDLELGGRETLSFTPVSIDLAATGDAILGADVWHAHAITIDYRAGLVTYQKNGMHDAMTVFRFSAEPEIDVTVDNHVIKAVVDTALPDTLVLPRATAGRGNARISIAGASLGDVDVKYANVGRPRIGNRLLSKFLVSIDYGARAVGLWRDTRTR
jgi:hypothetical protein